MKELSNLLTKIVMVMVNYLDHVKADHVKADKILFLF